MMLNAAAAVTLIAAREGKVTMNVDVPLTVPSLTKSGLAFHAARRAVKTIVAVSLVTAVYETVRVVRSPMMAVTVNTSAAVTVPVLARVVTPAVGVATVERSRGSNTPSSQIGTVSYGPIRTLGVAVNGEVTK